MGIFSSIKEKIFGKKAPEIKQVDTPSATAAPAAPAVPAEPVDIEAVLDAMPGASGLNWRTSIVDLMKLVGIDASYANRKELAQELGRTAYEGSAQDNIWLHKQTMQALADNGGKVPAAMLD